MDIIGMTSLQEAKLAREAEICYVPMAMVTDFDCWQRGETEVTVEAVVQNLNKNISMAKKIIHALVGDIPQKRSCICSTALKNAMMTAPGAIPEKTRRQLDPIIGKYLNE